MHLFFFSPIDHDGASIHHSGLEESTWRSHSRAQSTNERSGLSGSHLGNRVAFHSGRTVNSISWCLARSATGGVA